MLQCDECYLISGMHIDSTTASMVHALQPSIPTKGFEKTQEETGFDLPKCLCGAPVERNCRGTDRGHRTGPVRCHYFGSCFHIGPGNTSNISGTVRGRSCSKHSHPNINSHYHGTVKTGSAHKERYADCCADYPGSSKYSHG